LFYFFALILALNISANTGHIYVSGSLDLEEKKLDLSFIANTAEPHLIKSLTFVDAKNGAEKISLNLKLKPGSKQVVSIKLAQLGSTAGWRLTDVTQDSLLVIAPLRVQYPSVSKVLPLGWKRQHHKLVVPPGNYIIEKKLDLTDFNSVEFNDVTLFMGKDCSIEIKGDIKAHNFNIKPKDPAHNWSNFIVYAYGAQGNWKNVSVIGGKDNIARGLPHSCSFCIYGGTHNFEGLLITDSKAEDGLNIKEGIVTMINAQFKKNASDSFDCDWCSLQIKDSIFINSGGDGLDISGTKGEAKNLNINGMHDKGISIGENSHFTVSLSEINKSSIGIATKDSSQAVLLKNNFLQNKTDLAIYRKKHIWNSAQVRLEGNRFEARTIQKDSQAVIHE
jgi:hypothetical protein